MSDLKDKNIISEYLMYADKNYNKLRGNTNFYEASESLRIHIDDEMFLIVDSWDFIRELNEWLNDNYAKELCDETRYELPEDIRDREYFTTWLDYLTDGMWDFQMNIQFVSIVIRHLDLRLIVIHGLQTTGLVIDSSYAKTV